MPKHPLFCLLLTVALVLAEESKQEKALHLLVGGHLKIPKDESSTEIITSSASGSKEKKKKPSDERKTLSQQVADGRYGLLQKELFKRPPKRPGVLSYNNNPEVPEDNVANLGGLDKNEIWLAENHVLVVKGGVYPNYSGQNPEGIWPAIDDYRAPKRPVKIPLHPKVPPPFPVQLTDNGPLQILGTNASTTLNGPFQEGPYPLLPPEVYPVPYFPPPAYPYPANFTPGQAPYPNAPFPEGKIPPPLSVVPPNIPPPNTNISTVFDEDDLSIYYPPPYSFYYPKDNSSHIKPGPLVPGIVLPPPPDFFAPLEESTVTPTTTPKIRTTLKPPKQINQGRKTTTTTTQRQPIYVSNEINTISGPEEKSQPHEYPTTRVVNDQMTKDIMKLIKQNQLQPIVTILKSINTEPTPKRVSIRLKSQPINVEATLRPDIHILQNEITGKPFAVYGPPTSKLRPVVSPLKRPSTAYYSPQASTRSNYTKVRNTNYYQQPRSNEKGRNLNYPQASYTYTELPFGSVLPKTTTPFNYVPEYNYRRAPQKPTEPPPYREQYFQQTVVPKTNTFDYHIAKLQKQLHQYLTTPTPQVNYRIPKPVYQYSFTAKDYNYKPNKQLEENNQNQQQYFNLRQPQDFLEGGFKPIRPYDVQILNPTEQMYYRQSETPQYRQTRPQEHYVTKPPFYNYDQSYQTEEGQVEQNMPTITPAIQYYLGTTSSPAFYPENYNGNEAGNYQQNRNVPIKNSESLSQKPIYVPQSDHPQHQQQQQLPINNNVNFNNYRGRINSKIRFPESTSENVRGVPVSTGSEVIKAFSLRVPQEHQNHGSLISYQLPGDAGAHFYFLTPQLIQRNKQESQYYYSGGNNKSRRRVRLVDQKLPSRGVKW